MPTSTTTYALQKPTVGGDTDAWGTLWNANADTIDDLLDGTTAIAPNLVGWKVGGVAVSATAAQLNSTALASLSTIAGLTPAADRLPYYTGAGTAALATFTAAGRALVDDADAAAQRTTLGLVIGTNVQAFGATLTSLEALSLAAGDLLYATGADTLTRLPKGTASQLLQMNAGATAPEWVTPATTESMTLLGTLTTTSGTTQTLSSLTLTDYKTLRFVFNGVGFGSSGVTITLAGVTVVPSTTAGGNRYRGVVEIDLSSGAGYSVLGDVNTAAPSSASAPDVRALRTSISTATTSVSISAGTTFAAGTVLVYGVK